MSAGVEEVSWMWPESETETSHKILLSLGTKSPLMADFYRYYVDLTMICCSFPWFI